MQRLEPELVLVHTNVGDDPACRRRIDRLLSGIAPAEVRDIDDAGLNALAVSRWADATRAGQMASIKDPDLLLSRWDLSGDDEARRARVAAYPRLDGLLGGYSSVFWRGDGDPQKTRGSWCTSGWEFHSIYGCAFHCAYCALGSVAVHVAVNIEEQVGMFDRWTTLNNFQTLYKWDNISDIKPIRICFPELPANTSAGPREVLDF